MIYVQLEHEPEVTQEVRVPFYLLLRSFPATERGGEIRMSHLTQILLSYRVQPPSSEPVLGGISHLETTRTDRIIITPAGLCHRYAQSCPWSRPYLVFISGAFSALGYLYSSVSLSLIRPDNARGVLAAGCLLGGMDELCGYAYDACRQSISVETINEWLEFIDTIPSSPDGSLTPELSLTSVFGHFAQRLRDDVFHFLVVTLPNALEINSSESDPSQVHTGRDTLLRVFSLVPFDMFKSAVESRAFEIGKCCYR